MVDSAGIRSKKIQAAGQQTADSQASDSRASDKKRSLSCQFSCPISIGIGLIGLVFSLAAPSQASELVIKPNPIDKSTLRFQQTHFEHQRLEQAIQAQQQQAQARFDQLRARLLSPSTPSTPASGTYLYGQQPIANQPGTTYFVFETRGVELTGALYMPSSSFDCVQGQIKQEQIALDVIDSYSQERFSHALPLTPPLAQVANQTGTVAIPPAIEGFYSLPVQESDRTLLATCQVI